MFTVAAPVLAVRQIYSLHVHIFKGTPHFSDRFFDIFGISVGHVATVQCQIDTNDLNAKRDIRHSHLNWPAKENMYLFAPALPYAT